MVTKQVFVILPYLKTSNRCTIRGIDFRNNEDLCDLPQESREHLVALCEMFFLQEGTRINRMTCSLLDVPDNHTQQSTLLRRLYEAHLLIAYLYSAPHASGVFLPFECSSLFYFWRGEASRNDGMIWRSLVWETDADNRTTRVDDRAIPSEMMIPGYSGIRNHSVHLWVAKGTRIYPELHRLSLNISQDLAAHVEIFCSRPYNWGISQLYTSSRDLDLPEVQSRVFVGLEWYLRGCREAICDAEALVHTAIALESLLRIRAGDGLTERFKDAVLTLIGPIPRLDSWLEQFYAARSKAVHEGHPQDLMFYAIDREVLKRRRPSDETIRPHRSLIEYGRRVFRLCLNNLVSSAIQAESTGFPALFVENRERIETICKLLNDKGVPPKERILGTRRLVYELEEFAVDVMSEQYPDVRGNRGAARLLLESLKEAQMQMSNDTVVAIEDLLSSPEVKGSALLEKIRKCARALGKELTLDDHERGEIIAIAHALLNYVSGPGFILTCLREERRAGRS